MSEAEKIEAIGLETVVDPLIPDNSRHRSNNRQQDIRFEQRGNDYQNNHQNNYSLNGGTRNKTAQWNPPAPNTESHWNDMTNTNNFGSNLKRRKNIGKGTDQSVQEDNGTNFQSTDVIFLTESNNYECNRREFVNSKKRMREGSLKTKNHRDSFQYRVPNRRNEKYENYLENGVFKDKRTGNKTTNNTSLRSQTVESIEVILNYIYKNFYSYRRKTIFRIWENFMRRIIKQKKIIHLERENPDEKMKKQKP